MEVYMKLNLRKYVEKYLEENPGMSQTRLAVLAGVNPATLSKYMTGKSINPDANTVAKICYQIGITDLNQVMSIAVGTDDNGDAA